MNKVLLIGNVGMKPELKYVNDKPLCNFTLATNKVVHGEKKTTWHRIVVFGKPAESCAKYLEKGSRVFVEGEISKREYTDKQGFPKQSVEIVTYANVIFLSEPRREPKPDTSFDPSKFTQDEEIPF